MSGGGGGEGTREEEEEEGREAESPALLRCFGACDPSLHLLFCEGALLVGAPVPAGSCLVLTAELERTVVCTEVCMYYMGRGGGREGGGVGVNVAEAWARSQEQGAPHGMPWKNETEECRLH